MKDALDESLAFAVVVFNKGSDDPKARLSPCKDDAETAASVTPFPLIDFAFRPRFKQGDELLMRPSVELSDQGYYVGLRRRVQVFHDLGKSSGMVANPDRRGRRSAFFRHRFQ